jgi:cytochrome c oxidase cbb3-type subunit 2
VVPGSVMPSYPFLAEAELDGAAMADHLGTLRAVGVPYTEEQIARAAEDFAAQANPDADASALLARYPRAAVANFDGDPRVTELDALIAYLQMLGTLVEFPAAKADAGPASTATATAAAQ